MSKKNKMKKMPKNHRKTKIFRNIISEYDTARWKCQEFRTKIDKKVQILMLELIHGKLQGSQ